jgi:hypothetical protein
MDGTVSLLKPNQSLVSLTGVFDRRHRQSHGAGGARPLGPRRGWLPLPRGLDPPSQRGRAGSGQPGPPLAALIL